ncbi:LacI family DNA-binding transcriptional regulator [Winogradskyella sp.]|uniref:LacI family DNA-binding transcriptional regulator n=1 Tax=Winogradskyella sp. TaxID=1883156 RepID=UPI0025D80152|nr:LacI family DNA-binding transcriptional regulator [Winogradskyella sp.]
MIQSRTTLSEMSKALNLSISTVSKSLSDSSEISALTKKRVNEFARQCNYIPNNLAASFRKGYTNTIGLVIPNILNPFYAKVLVGIENYLDDKGYRLITSISNESQDKESKSLNKMASGYVDGLIICISKETELKNKYDHINGLIGQGTPIVMFDRICEMIDCDKVIIDDYKAAYDTTEHLISNEGCKNIIMTSLINNLHHGKLRAEGYKNAMKSQNLDVNGKILVANTVEGLKEKLSAKLKTDKTIDAIFGVNEQAVLQAMHTTRRLKTEGFKNKITIAGFCNQCQSDYNPSLIIVNQNAEEIGTQTAKLLLKRIKSTEIKGYRTKTVAVNLS